MTHLSDDNSVASGDDSKGWEREDQRMEALIAAQNEAEQKAADEERPVILPVVFDWETLDHVEEEPTPSLILPRERSLLPPI